MKKLLAGMVIASLTLSMGSVTAFAGQRNCGGRYSAACNNGVCNNSGYNANSNYVDNNGDGICDNKGNNSGSNYVDADHNGICDNQGSNICGSQTKKGCRSIKKNCGRR